MKQTEVMANQRGRWDDTLLHRLGLLAGLLCGFAVRLFHLGGESLWYDETVSVYLATKPIAAMIAHTGGDIHPPGYYFLLHFWQAWTRPTVAHGLEFLHIWPSLWFGVLILVLLYPIGCRLLDRRVGLLALWLTAIHPFHIWYSQEARMYTLGGALGLVGLWAIIRYMGAVDKYSGTTSFKFVKDALPWLGLYAGAAAAGLYTLYYFAFLLIALNLIALLALRRNAQLTSRWRPTPWVAWLFAQVVVLALWSPWLPIFWRQATEPPVPPWRVPWQNMGELLTALGESLAALFVGQSLPGQTVWPWALLTLIILAFFLRFSSESTPSLFLLSHVLLPPLLIYLVSLTFTPLYHVRYLFTYAPPFALITAVGLLALARFNRWLAVGALAGVVAVSAWSLREFWFNPLYRADDHRAAVAELAANWRPGDGILVNAGWVYPALVTYWPTELAGPRAAAPPPIAWLDRFTNYAQRLATQGDAFLRQLGNEPPLVVARTGSVNGSSHLGWGNPQSDFFAVADQEVIAALEQIVKAHPRLWHYRLYDTVNDPDSVIRAWLDAHITLQKEESYLGRDFLLIQLYARDQRPPATPQNDAVEFGAALRLEGHVAPSSQNAGELLYVNLFWTALPGLRELSADLSMSLRLYDAAGELLAQQDAPPLQPTSRWPIGENYRQLLALPAPAAAKPGRYHLELVVYRQDSGAALPLPEQPRSIYGQRWRLGDVHILLPTRLPEVTRALARFDYLELVEATATQAEDGLAVELIWRPRASRYTDNYMAIIELRDDGGAAAQSWAELVGGADYPSGQWPAFYPVREVRRLPLRGDLTPGRYRLTLRLERSSDGLPIAVRRGWRPGQVDYIEIRTMALEGRP